MIKPNNKPLISILLPIHNSGKYLKECLKSLKTQSYRNIEVIAIDDKSYDNSFEILKEMRKKDKRFKIAQNVKRYGIVITLNRLLAKAKGEYIAFMEADDISDKERFRKQIEFFLANPQAVACGTQCYFVNSKNKRIGKSAFPVDNKGIYTSPLHGLSMQFETVMVNKTLLPKDFLKFDSSANHFIYSDFLIRLLPYGKFANLGNFLHYHRNNPSEYIQDLLMNILSFIKLCLRSRELHDYQAGIRLFFLSIIKPLRLVK